MRRQGKPVSATESADADSENVKQQVVECVQEMLDAYNKQAETEQEPTATLPEDLSQKLEDAAQKRGTTPDELLVLILSENIAHYASKRILS